MELELPTDLLQFVHGQVSNGSYVDANQLIAEAVRKLQAEKAALPLREHLLAMPEVGEDWMFDRNDPRMTRPEKEQLDFSE
jgi:Arc/MetJ-type ribon-helix-helix transcriptional regulator